MPFRDVPTRLLVVLGLLFFPVGHHSLGQEEARPATVSVRVLTDQGEVVDGPRHVALVDVGASWRDPLFEAVVDDSAPSPTWRVPPGDYRWSCAARGHSLTYVDEPRSLAPGSETVLDCSVTPLITRSGRAVTVSESGETVPVAGARVGRLRSFLPDFSLRLGPTGEEFVAAERLDRSDDDGRFEIHGPAGFTGEIWVEAEGLAPRWLRAVPFDGPGEMEPVVLEPGGGLTVDLATAPPPGLTHLVLVPGEGVPRSLARLGPRLWRRAVGPTGGSFSWPSLAPGRYAVRLQGDEHGSHRRPPLEVGAVEIAAGDTEQLEIREVVELSAEMFEDDSPAPDLVLSLGLDPADAPGLAATVWPRADAPPTTPEPTVSPLDGGGSRITLTGACREGTIVVVDVTGEEPLISEAVDVTPALAARCRRGEVAPRPVRLFSASRVEGLLRAPTGSELPTGGVLSASICASVDRTAEGAQLPARRRAIPHLGGYPFVFDPDDAGRFRVAVPAGCLDLLAEVGDFTALPLPDVRLPVGGATDSGDHTLSYGASVLARVLDPAGEPVAGARVSAVPPAELPATYARAFARHPEPWSDPARGRLAARTDGRGWARLYGLAPGEAHLLVEPDPPEPETSGVPGATDGTDPLVIPFGAGELLPHATEAVRLLPRTEEMQDEIVLPVPARLEVRLAEPPEPVVDDEGEAVALTLVVHLRGEFEPATSQVQLRRQVPTDGTAVFAPLPPGLWTYGAVLEGAERSTVFPIAGNVVDLLPGMVEVLELETDARSRRGRVTFRGEGVRARLDFLADDESVRKRPTATSEDDGRFRVLFDARGTYAVRIQQFPDQDADPDEAPPFFTVVPGIEVGEADEPLLIEVPDGAISGRVVSDDGQPVAGGFVRARQEAEIEPLDAGDGSRERRGPFTRPLDGGSRIRPDGSFEIVALGPGSWTLEASAADRRSDPVVVTLGRDERRPGVELVLEVPRESTVRVVAADGRPLHRARVELTPISPDPQVTVGRRGLTTGADGMVPWPNAPDPGTEVLVAVNAPGLPAWAGRLPVPAGDRPLEIVLPPVGGAVEVTFDGTPPDPSRLYLVAPDGGYLWGLTPNLDEIGDRLSLPRLAPGSWSLVLTRSAEDERAVLRGRGHLIHPLAEFVVEAGEVTETVVHGRD